MGYPSPGVDVRTGAGEPLLNADVVVVAVETADVTALVVVLESGSVHANAFRRSIIITLPWLLSSASPLRASPTYSRLGSRPACTFPRIP